MLEISLTLVVQLQVNKTPNDIAKIAQKNEKITAFGGINFVLDKFDAILRDVIDHSLGIRSTSFGYLYSEIVSVSVFTPAGVPFTHTASPPRCSFTVRPCGATR